MSDQQTEEPVEQKKSSAIDSAFNGILDLVHEKGLGPGDQIPSEAKLAEECSVGRGSVREAVKALAQLGVLSVQNGRRAQVAEVSGDNLAVLINHAVQTSQVSIIQTWDFRQTIESRIARLASLRRSEQQVTEMREICDSMFDAIGDPVALTKADIALHLAWAQAADNPLYLLNMQSLTIVMNWTGPVGYAALGDDEAVKRHLNLHVDITNAIADRRADDAVAKMLDHFDQARTCMLDAGFN